MEKLDISKMLHDQRPLICSNDWTDNGIVSIEFNCDPPDTISVISEQSLD